MCVCWGHFSNISEREGPRKIELYYIISFDKYNADEKYKIIENLCLIYGSDLYRVYARACYNVRKNNHPVAGLKAFPGF